VSAASRWPPRSRRRSAVSAARRCQQDVPRRTLGDGRDRWLGTWPPGFRNGGNRVRMVARKSEPTQRVTGVTGRGALPTRQGTFTDRMSPKTSPPRPSGVPPLRVVTSSYSPQQQPTRAACQSSALHGPARGDHYTPMPGTIQSGTSISASQCPNHPHASTQSVIAKSASTQSNGSAAITAVAYDKQSPKFSDAGCRPLPKRSQASTATA